MQLPVLRDGVVLVDTPGAGSLEKSHGEITLEALRHAAALIIVVDATAEMSRPETEFLRQTAETIDLVLFALTKKDADTDFHTILEGTGERIAKRGAEAGATRRGTRWRAIWHG